MNLHQPFTLPAPSARADLTMKDGAHHPLAPLWQARRDPDRARPRQRACDQRLCAVLAAACGELRSGRVRHAQSRREPAAYAGGAYLGEFLLRYRGGVPGHPGAFRSGAHGRSDAFAVVDGDARTRVPPSRPLGCGLRVRSADVATGRSSADGARRGPNSDKLSSRAARRQAIFDTPDDLAAQYRRPAFARWRPEQADLLARATSRRMPDGRWTLCCPPAFEAYVFGQQEGSDAVSPHARDRRAAADHRRRSGLALSQVRRRRWRRPRMMNTGSMSRWCPTPRISCNSRSRRLAATAWSRFCECMDSIQNKRAQYMTDLSDLRIPYGAYWSTPFTRWQGALSDLNSLKLAAATGAKVAKDKNWPLETLDHAVLGITVPQEKSFWGAPWVMTMMGAPFVTGPTVSQACATSAARALGRGGRNRRRRCDRLAGGDLRPHLQLAGGDPSQSEGAERRADRRELDARQFQRRADRAFRDGRYRRKLRARLADLDAGAARACGVALRPVPRRAERRQGVPAALHDAALRRARCALQERCRDAGRRRGHPRHHAGGPGASSSRCARAAPSPSADRPIRPTAMPA